MERLELENGYGAVVGGASPGEQIHRTLDFLTAPGRVSPCHASATQVIHDHQRIRELEENRKSFVVKPVYQPEGRSE